NRHGSQVLAEGYAGCINCHQVDRSGYAGARSCLDCHAGFYPHGLIPNWETTGHGQTALNSVNRRVCGERCHGESLTGAGAAPSCFSCHTEFPHSSRSDEWVGERQVLERICRTCDEGDEGFCDDSGEICWDSPVIHMSRHGESFLAQKDAGFPESPNRCSVCHGSDYQGGASGVSCGGTCHSGFSEHLSDPDWSNSNGGSHGTAYRTGPAGTASSCVVCHLNFDRGRDARAPACASCHINYPHLSDWLSARRHGFGFIINEWLDDGTEARQNACASCHGDNFRGAGDPVKDCASCHEHYGAVSHLGCCERSGRWASTAHPNARQAILDGDTDRCTQCHGTTPVEPRFLSAFCTTCHQRR
ncbi:MAG: hypothetical protein HY539_04385, partial [Deltaproteobacteria bacterium]|nr:hypothetical protein [Deltaproteobacteria bacterium]